MNTDSESAPWKKRSVLSLQEICQRHNDSKEPSSLLNTIQQGEQPDFSRKEARQRIAMFQKNLVHQISIGIVLKWKDRHQPIVIQLTPHILGQLHIDLSSISTGTIVLTTDSLSTEELLLMGKTYLKNELGKKGLKITHCIINSKDEMNSPNPPPIDILEENDLKKQDELSDTEIMASSEISLPKEELKNTSDPTHHHHHLPTSPAITGSYADLSSRPEESYPLHQQAEISLLA